MVKIVSSALVTFTLLYLACILNAIEDNRASNYDDSPEDPTKIVSSSKSFNNSSPERIIHPSTWSKEEKRYVKPIENRHVGNKDISSDEEFSLWNMKKLFRYVESLLYKVDQIIDGSLDKSTEKVKIKMQNPTNDDFFGESDKDMKTEKLNPANTDSLNEPEDDDRVQNSAITLNKSSDDEKIQILSNNDSPSKEKSTENLENKTQNPINKDSTYKLENNMKTETQKVMNADTHVSDEQIKTTNNREIQNSATNDTINKSSYDGGIQILSNNYSPIIEEEMDECEDENDNDEYEINKDEIDTDENKIEDNHVNEKVSSEVEGNNINENSYTNDKNRLGNSNQNTQTALIADERANDILIAMPKFIIQAIRDQQNNSENQPLRNQSNNTNLTPEAAKSQNITNKEIYPDFQLNSEEFIDDYINYPQRKFHEKKHKNQSNDKAITLQNEGYLNDNYALYNFKTFDITNGNNHQFEQNQPVVFHQDPNIQRDSNRNSSDKPTYFKNYKQDVPVNATNAEKSIINKEKSSNNLVSDDPQFNSAANRMHNHDSSSVDTENNLNILNKMLSRDQLDAMKVDDQIDDVQTLNLQSHSANLPLPNNVSGQKILFPQNLSENLLLQNEMNKRTPSHENKIVSEIVPVQDDLKNKSSPFSQNGSNNSKTFLQRSFSNKDDNLQDESEDKNSSPVIPKHIAENLSPQQTETTSMKLLPDVPQKNEASDTSRGQVQRASNSETDSDSINSHISGESLIRNYDNEYDDDDEESTSVDEDDYVSENNYKNEDDRDEEDEDYDEGEEFEDYEDYEDEDEDDDDENVDEDDDNENGNKDEDYYIIENYNVYEEIKDGSSIQKSQSTVNLDETTGDNTILSPKFMSKGHSTSGRQNHSVTQPTRSQINNQNNALPESVKFQEIKEGKKPSLEIITEEIIDDNHLREKPKKENEEMSFSDKTINDAKMQVAQTSISTDANVVTELPETFITHDESKAFNEKGNFDTILEYIYKFSNNSLFKGIKNDKNKTS